ncbi:hypothetical protein P4S72_10585 [Vibrio sp. PP-XX7]
MKSIYLSLFVLLLAGCTATPASTACDTAQLCDRPLSSASSLVIWWGKGMRYGLDNATRRPPPMTFSLNSGELEQWLMQLEHQMNPVVHETEEAEHLC